MIAELIQIYRHGKYLGLPRKEVNNLLFYNEKKHQILSRILFYSILLVFFFLIFLFTIFFGLNTADSTYPSGAKYSTIKIKDFKKKNEIKYRLWKKIRTRLLQYRSI